MASKVTQSIKLVGPPIYRSYVISLLDERTPYDITNVVGIRYHWPVRSFDRSLIFGGLTFLRRSRSASMWKMDMWKPHKVCLGGVGLGDGRARTISKSRGTE
jgi:hypothetical protein